MDGDDRSGASEEADGLLFHDPLTDAGDGAAEGGRGDGRRAGAPEGDGPAALADGEDSAPGGDVRCKLLRGDGSEWTVTELSLAPDGLHVSGYRYVRDDRPPVAEPRRETLDDELVDTDDRIWCLNRRGAVLWVLSRPGRDVTAPDGVGEAIDV